MVFFDVIDDDSAHVRARHVPVEVHLGEGGTRVVVLAAVVVEGATELPENMEHMRGCLITIFPALSTRHHTDQNQSCP